MRAWCTVYMYWVSGLMYLLLLMMLLYLCVCIMCVFSFCVFFFGGGGMGGYSYVERKFDKDVRRWW